MHFSSNQKYNISNLKYHTYYVAIFILYLFFFSGCSVLPSSNRFLKKNFEEYQIKRVAVLPFYNQSTAIDASGIVTKAFIGELFDSGKFEIEFQGNIKKIIVGERIIIRKGIGADHIKLIGKRLNVDAIIIGCIEKYEIKGKKQNVQLPVISVAVRMIHADSCSILWIGQNCRRGDDYETSFGIGRIISLPALSRKVVSELIDTIP